MFFKHFTISNLILVQGDKKLYVYDCSYMFNEIFVLSWMMIVTLRPPLLSQSKIVYKTKPRGVYEYQQEKIDWILVGFFLDHSCYSV